MTRYADGLPSSVAIVGAGVIGAAWAARWTLRGVDVSVADPSPDAPQIVSEVCSNARRAWDRLDLLPDAEGALTFADSVAGAAEGSVLIQESAPENLELKHSVYRDIETAAATDAVIASSTSGLRPIELQRSMTHPERLVVGHPFNPVYLLPMVEVVSGEATSPAVVDAAVSWYQAAAMRPLRVRVEIDAFVADRLMEALWREALWLVHDGVATTGEIDDPIRYGFGLRWGQMGLFETYRVAGGEAGMGHFIRQFGPSLKRPWSKLTDVPELTDELVDRIEEQSDAQAAGRSVSELE
ncbi:MAG: 3-hydroxyacyl-CoA dehydrogenase NAD-binding domain-containing protein, partial [Actinomycetota bacterium]|nr:3-hydroxyacyl-CoA dehydrogenase NAD-binding domain-containing protein [Actinomycetota bacterium]